MKKDYDVIKIAKMHERSARRHEKGKLDSNTPSDLSPLNIGKEYSIAAEYWIKAKNPKKAFKDYIKAKEVYSREAEIRLKGSQNPDDCNGEYSYYGAGYKNLINASKEAQRKAERLKKVLKGEWHGLEGKVTAVAVISILGILGGIFFLSPNLTGNAIGNMANSTSNIIGLVLFVTGIVGAFFYFRRR